jgi:hypothetical protein
MPQLNPQAQARELQQTMQAIRDAVEGYRPGVSVKRQEVTAEVEVKTSVRRQGVFAGDRQKVSGLPAIGPAPEQTASMAAQAAQPTQAA